MSGAGADNGDMHEDTESLKLFVERLTGAQSALYGCIHAMMAGAPTGCCDCCADSRERTSRHAASQDGLQRHTGSLLREARHR